MEQFKAKKVTEQNIREFADLKDGYASGRFDYQTGGKATEGWQSVDGELDAPNPKATTTDGWVPVSGDLDSPAGHSFKSGSAFEATKDLIPDMGEVWDTFQKQWKNRKNTPMTAEIGQKMIKDEKAAGSAVLDIVGGIPAMAVGGIAGVGSAVANMDATKGLQTAGDVMTSMLPSTLMGNKDHQEAGGYHAAMAPLTAMMDTLNAVPQGYGEIINAVGAPNAAAQVTDAGKLAIMAVIGTKGAMAMYKSITGKEARTEAEAATALERLQALNEQRRAAEQPTLVEGTLAHADDFAATNPYDVGGHVTEAKAGRPSTIDNVQGELFGERSLQDPLASPKSPVDSLLNTPENAIPYERLELGGEPLAPKPALEMPMVPDRLELVPKEEAVRPPEMPAERPILDSTGAKAHEAKLADAFLDKPIDKEAGFAAAERQKEVDYNAMEAQRELDFNATARRIEEQGVRRMFLERDNFDFQEATKSGDKNLMRQDHTTEMRDHMRRGDTKAALEVLAKNHPERSYRELAEYLNDKVEGLSIELSPESIIRHGERDITGYYDPQTHRVVLSGRGATSPHTVLHELTHAVTSHFINTNPKDMRVMGLKSLFKTMVNEKGMKEFPGIVNVKEFVAEAFSNPKFQEFLKGQRMNNKTVWQRFVDNVKSVFGLRGETSLVNAFEHAMDLGKQVVEAQTGKDAARETLKKGGLSNKLADLMAQAPRDARPEIVRGGAVRDLRVPGLEHAVSDFAFYDKPIGEIVEMARNAPDIPGGYIEKFAQQMQGGALFESLKTRNPVVKYTYERITRAFQEASKDVKENLTNQETGIKRYMRDLAPAEKGGIHAVSMMHEGKRELSSTDLAGLGMNEKQIAYYNKQRELDTAFYDRINQRRVAMGLAKMDKRVAHIAGRFLGDFTQMVYKDGKVVGRIAGSTKRELGRAEKFMKEQHPEWDFEAPTYNSIGKGRNAKDRFAGLMEAINFIEKADGDVKALVDSYRGYMQSDAVNYLNATRHAKAKVNEPGGVVGSEGHKPWLDTIKNAEEGMKAQLAYFEQGYQWMAMEKAVGDLKQVLGDEQVAKNSPNAVAYAEKYKDHAMGRNQGVFADAANTLLSRIGEHSGFGHSNLMKINNVAKHLIMQKFMGVMNVPFTLTQLSQPLQTQPAMIRLMRSRGLEFSTLKAQKDAMQTYLVSMTEGFGVGRLSEFERAAVKYADDMSVFDVKMADHTKDINVGPIRERMGQMADFNIVVPEHITRGTTFLFYSHALKEAGIPQRDIFSAAENMTNMSMVNYHRIERPMGYAKLGWIGDVASTLTRYKHNQWSQLAFYERTGRKEGSYSPLATFVGSSLAFGGLMGLFAFQEADALYQLFSEHVTKKPDSLTNVVFESGMPELISHGAFSTVGMDMTTRFSNANLIPDSIPAALMPYGSAILDMADTTKRFVLDPTNEYKQKQMVKSFAPQSTQGLIENKLFTEKLPNGNGLYQTPTDGPNLGKGRAERTPDEMSTRNFGFRNIKESKELAKNYSDSQISKQHANIAERTMTKIKYGVLGDKMSTDEISELVTKAVEVHGADANKFVGELVSWEQSRKLTQAQQIKLRNALGGYSGAFKIKEAN